jgi:hypothetical protein
VRFAVIKHPDLDRPGTCPESALEIHRAQGWFRVSDWSGRPDDFHLTDYADASTDLDAVAETKPATRATARRADAASQTEETAA